MPGDSSSSRRLEVEIRKQMRSSSFSLYLFSDQSEYPESDWCYVLYKIDIDLTATTTYKETPVLYLSPILEFPRGEYPARGMRCARLGSKLYFLGGTVEDDNQRVVCHPRDVYVFDMLTNEFKKMDARLNAGKPKGCAVFAANGKLYALARIPYNPRIPRPDLPVYLSKMKLFECFDPTTNKWQVVDTLPPIDMDRDWLRRPVYKGMDWVGCNVLAKRQQVVLIGRVFPFSHREDAAVKLVYHLQQDKWTSHILSSGTPDGFVTLSFQEAADVHDDDDDDYLYGLTYNVVGPPVKLKSGFFRVQDEFNLLCKTPVDGVVEMSIPDTPKKEMYTFFKEQQQLYSNFGFTRFLRYVGKGHFCHIATAMLPSPMHGLSAYEDTWDECTRGITITLFKEIKQVCFQAQILHSQSYAIQTPFPNDSGKLEGCFVVTPEQLQRKLDRKKKKRNKNVQ